MGLYDVSKKHKMTKMSYLSLKSLENLLRGLLARSSGFIDFFTVVLPFEARSASQPRIFIFRYFRMRVPLKNKRETQ